MDAVNSVSPDPTKRASPSADIPLNESGNSMDPTLHALLLQMSNKLDLIQSQLVADRSRLGALEEKCVSNEKRLDAAEGRVSDVEDKVTGLSADKKKIQMLEEAVVQLENRNRRNNIRVYGLPEGVEKEEPVRFLEQWLPRALKLHLDGPLEIQRAHRIPTRSQGGGSAPPRPMIAYILRFTQVDLLLKKARELKKIEYAGHTIYVGPDYAKQTATLRKRFLDLRPRMRMLGMRYGLLYPARMLVTWKSKDKFFLDPNDLASFLDQCETEEGTTCMEAKSAGSSTPPRAAAPPQRSPISSANRWAALFKEPQGDTDVRGKVRSRNRSPRHRRHRSSEMSEARDPDLRSPRK